MGGETAWDRKTGEAHHQLEAYFPFDPYHLPQSKRWVTSDYNEWRLPSGMRREADDEGDESEDSEGEESEVDDEDEEEEESEVESLPEALEQYTPARAVAA